jgi:hypothetical protein
VKVFLCAEAAEGISFLETMEEALWGCGGFADSFAMKYEDTQRTNVSMKGKQKKCRSKKCVGKTLCRISATWDRYNQ